MEKLKELNDIKHDLIDAVKTELSKGIENVDTEELGEVIDMIKDIASAEESCMEACYYEVVTEAMSDYEGNQGYDRWRYSSGRFAPKGRGTYGYLPPVTDEMIAEPMGYDSTRTRYDGTTRSNRMANTSYGYTHKMGMHDGKSSKEEVEEAVATVGEIWADADPELRKKMRTQFQDLLYQMEQS